MSNARRTLLIDTLLLTHSYGTLVSDFKSSGLNESAETKSKNKAKDEAATGKKKSKPKKKQGLFAGTSTIPRLLLLSTDTLFPLSQSIGSASCSTKLISSRNATRRTPKLPVLSQQREGGVSPERPSSSMSSRFSDVGTFADLVPPQPFGGLVFALALPED